jgi:hypothetical protein
LSQEALLAGAIIIIFLLHLRSTVSVLTTLPLSFAFAFVLMYLLGVDSNIMSLAGLAIAIGDVGDMGIIMTENIYRHVAAGNGSKSLFQKVYDGASEVGGAIVTAFQTRWSRLSRFSFSSIRRAKCFVRSPTPRHSRSPLASSSPSPWCRSCVISFFVL